MASPTKREGETLMANYLPTAVEPDDDDDDTDDDDDDDVDDVGHGEDCDCDWCEGLRMELGQDGVMWYDPGLE